MSLLMKEGTEKVGIVLPQILIFFKLEFLDNLLPITENLTQSEIGKYRLAMAILAKCPKTVLWL